MTFARFQTAMNHTDEDGVVYRAQLEASARAGNPLAITKLVEPPFPDPLRYLWDWCLEIRQGLGADINGLASLTWNALDAWARRTRRRPKPYEVAALFALDGVLRERGEPSAAEPAESPDRGVSLWLTKRGSDA